MTTNSYDNEFINSTCSNVLKSWPLNNNGLPGLSYLNTDFLSRSKKRRTHISKTKRHIQTQLLFFFSCRKMLKIFIAFKPREWREKTAYNLISIVSFIVFAFLDLLDILLCLFYRYFDRLFKEENNFTCYCENNKGRFVSDDQVSESLYQRKNMFRDLGFLEFIKKDSKVADSMKKDGSVVKKKKNRWSDCNCESCISWQKNGNQKLHVVLKEPSQETNEFCIGNPVENVIFLHGFMASSSLWIEMVFPNLSEFGKQYFRLFAVDLLGFGRSPKPLDCLYTLKDHLEMVEKSVIEEFQLNSFHLVAHSMGCIIALALAAKYPSSVKSITLIAPPYFPSSSKEETSLNALNRLAEKRLWPPLLFGSSVMSWYEHVGRSICFIVCRNHRTWEWLLKSLTRKRDLHFMLMDTTKHTHHSAWHSMHNVICGGAKFVDGFLEVVNKSGMVLTIIQGDKDKVIALECIQKVKLKVPLAEIKMIPDVHHSTVMLGREKNFTRDLEHIWFSVAEKNHKQRNF